MPAPPKYPTITDATLIPLRALQLQLKEFPDLLDRVDCPYPAHIKSFMRPLLGDASAPIVQQSYDDDDLEREITGLYNDLKTLATGSNSGDAKDRVSIIKQSAELMGKLIGFRERIQNVREMGKFQKLVLEVLETIVTPDQRADFVEKLGKYVDV